MIIAVDTGGTKTLVASFSEQGRIITSFQFPTPKTAALYVQTLHNELEQQFGTEKVDAIVIGMPSTVRNNIAVWAFNLHWKDFDVVTALKGVLGNAPIFVENDANLAGLAEARQLSVLPTSCLYITVSTGIGSGIITNGVIDPGLRYSEAGQALIEYDGVVRRWETFASGKAIYRVYGKYARDITSKRTWRQIADRISRGLLALIPILQPEVIIIGGSIGTFYQKYGRDLNALLKEHLPDHIPLPAIHQAKHPEQAVIYGCYYYALDALATA